MKTIKRFLGLSIIAGMATMVLSCGGSSDDGGGGFSGPSTGTFVKAKTAGANFLAEGQYANGGVSSGNLVLQGISMTGKSINIQLYCNDGSIDVASYNANDSQNSDAYVASLSYIEINTSTMTSITYSSLFCENANGSIEITTSNSDKIEGTFSFIGKEVRENDDCSGGTKNITNGSFRYEF